MLRDMLRKVVGEEKYDTKRRLKESDDLVIIIDGMDEMHLRQYASRHLSDVLAWGTPIDKLKNWYIDYKEEINR